MSEPTRRLALPKKIYFVRLRQGEGERIWLYEKRGGRYASKPAAEAAVRRHRSKGREARLFETATDWTEVDVD